MDIRNKGILVSASAGKSFEVQNYPWQDNVVATQVLSPVHAFSEDAYGFIEKQLPRKRVSMYRE